MTRPRTSIAAAGSFLALLMAYPTFAGPGTTGGNPMIEAVYGKGAPTLTIGEDSYELKEGQELQAGNKVTTDGESSVRIVYQDNSQLYVGRNSEIEVGASRGGAPVTTLLQGKTRAIVSKNTQVDETVDSKPAPRVKFIIRTKSAVMGVRGTDFVTQTDADGGSSQIHTLEGEVAVARPGDEAGLFAGRGILLGPNQFLQSKLGAVIGKPQLFQRTQFLKNLGADQPMFKNLMDRMPRGYQQLMKLRGLPNNLGTGLQQKSLDDLQKLKMPKIPAIPPLRR
jgi:hypothetical protein